MKRFSEESFNCANTVVRRPGFLLVFPARRCGRSCRTIAPLVLPLLFLSVIALPGTAGAYEEGIDQNFFGGNAGDSITTGFSNSFFGGNSGAATTSGSNNSFFGYAAGTYNATGSYNAFFGNYSGAYNTTGASNSFFGKQSGFYNTTGAGSSSFGYGSGAANTVENYNTFIGYNADLYPGGAPATNPVTNATAIGAYSLVASSNSLVLGSSKGVNGATADVNVGIGTTAPQRQLHLKGTNALFRMDRPMDTAAFMLVRTDATGSPLKTFVVGANASGTNTGEFIVNDLGTAVGGVGTRRMTIKNNGAVQFTGSVTAASYFTASSLALKDNVRTFAHALDTVSRLRGVRFDWKDSGQPAVGLIAEEVETVLPEVVTHADNGAAAGVSYASLVGVLVEAVKEQQAKIDTQQTTIAAQQSEMQATKAAHQAEMADLRLFVQRQEQALVEYREALTQQQETTARLVAKINDANHQGVIAQQ